MWYQNLKRYDISLNGILCFHYDVEEEKKVEKQKVQKEVQKVTHLEEKENKQKNE